MTPKERLDKIIISMDDYSEELWADEQFRDNMMFLLARYINEGVDLTDDELITLESFVNNKIEEYVKNKGN
jgi:hypothetical protein